MNHRTQERRQPKIGIVCSENDPTPAGESRRNQVSIRYVESIRGAGGLPFLIPIQYPLDALYELQDLFDGFLLVGGNDVAIDRFGGLAHASVSAPNPERDALEIALSKNCYAKRIPLLGICRGAQVMNVALGGTLYTDIPSQVPTTIRHNQSDAVPIDKLTQRISIVPDTRLRSIVSAEVIWINTFHHQAVDRLGNGLVASAYAADGIVEAFEAPDSRFFVGTQYHPEGLQAHEPHRAIFKSLVDAAAERNQG